MRWSFGFVVAASVGCGFPALAFVRGQDAEKNSDAPPAAPKTVFLRKRAAPEQAKDKAENAAPIGYMKKDAAPGEVKRKAASAPPAVPAEKVQIKTMILLAPRLAKPVEIEKRDEARRAKALGIARPAAKVADAFENPFLPGLDGVNAPPVVMVEPPLPAIDPLAQQFLPQFRQLMRTEIHLVQTACKLSKDQRTRIDKAGEKAALSAAKKYGEFQQKMMQGQWNGNDGNPEPRDLVRDSLATLLKAQLSPDQQARYKEETAQRKSNRRHVAVQNLVAKLDDELVLSAEQREKLGESLLKNWNDAWGQSLEMFLQNDQFFPNIPDQVVTPFLNRTQKQVWQGIPKNGGVFFGNFGFNNMVIDVDGLDGEVEIENAAAIVVEELAPDPKEKKKPE